MRSLIIASLIILGSYSTSAQSNEPYIYGEIGGGGGSHGMFQMTMNAIFSNNNIISLSYYYASHRSPNTPSDYNVGLAGLFNSYPQQYLSAWGLSYGKVFFLNNPRIRFTIKGGIATNAVSTPVNFVQVPASSLPLFGGSQYNFSYRNDNVLGLVLNPTVEFPLSRGFGFSVGLYSNINAVSSVFGVEASMMFGKLRDKNTMRRIFGK